MNEKLIYLCLILSLISIIGMSYLLYNYSISDWEIITQYCKTKITGENWIKDNCAYKNDTLLCSFIFQGQNFDNIPVEQIDTNRMLSCKEYIWDKKVLIRTNPDIEKI